MASPDLRPGFCLDCEEIRGIRGRGLCEKCYRRRRSLKTVKELPLRVRTIGLYEEFLEVEKLEPGASAKRIAERIGVDRRTIVRYRAHRRGTEVIKCLAAVGL